MEWAGDNESFGVAEAGGNFGVLPTQRPKVLPGLPRGHLGVDQRTLGDVQPSLHADSDQVVANFLACVHFGSKFWALQADFPFLGLCRNRGTRLSKTNDLALPAAGFCPS